MNPGETLIVKAEENPSTGYQWLLLDEELDFHGLTEVIRAGESRFEPPQKEQEEPILVGSPGTRSLEIVALTEGAGTCHLILGRPWEVRQAFEEGRVYEPVGNIRFDVDVKHP